MSKLRSYVASDLDSLNDRIVSLLALSAEYQLTVDSFNSFVEQLDSVYSLVHNRFYCDLIRKK